MKTLIVMALSAIFAVAPQVDNSPKPEDFKIVSDKTEAGVRTIVATPSPLVCAKQIEIKIGAKDNIVQELIVTRGCPGNAKAVASLVKGLTVDQVIQKLDGIPCGNRGTSCTDQLARILKKAYKK